jgi:hypothetical protein
MFRHRRLTACQGFASDNRRCKHRGLIRLDKPAFPSQPAPREQLARGQPVSPRRHRHKPCPAIALRHDSVLLVQRPTAPRARRDNVKPRGLRNRRMLSHTPMSSLPHHFRQGGLRRRNTRRAGHSYLIGGQPRLRRKRHSVRSRKCRDLLLSMSNGPPGPVRTNFSSPANVRPRGLIA